MSRGGAFEEVAAVAWAVDKSRGMMIDGCVVEVP